MKKYLYMLGGAVIAVVISVVGISLYLSQVDEAGAWTSKTYATDVIGTKTGTSTTGVAFATNAKVAGLSGTSTYPVRVGNSNLAYFTFDVTEASSTATMQLEVLASNDDQCWTATTTTVYDVPTKNQINWFDASPFFDGHAAQSLGTGTSSVVVWNTSNAKGTGRSLLLTNLTAECLSLNANGSSTVFAAQIRTK